MASLLNRLWLCLWLLWTYGKVSAEGSLRITASVGDTVILPCHILSSDLPSVEWSKEGLDPDVVFLFRDGCETPEMKHPSFWYRTSLIMNEVKDGNMSLRISNLQLSDGGTYRCKFLKMSNNPEVVATAELVVGAVSEPKLVLVPSEGVGVTVECKADCWFPQPLLTLLDDQGNEIRAEESEKTDSGDCFTITMRTAVQTGTNRVMCRVHQPQTKQTRVTDIYIPDCCKRSCITVAATSVLLAVLALCGLCALTLFLWKRTECLKLDHGPVPVSDSSEGNQKMSVQNDDGVIV